MIMQFVHVLKITLVARRLVDQNVQLIPIVYPTERV